MIPDDLRGKSIIRVVRRHNLHQVAGLIFSLKEHREPVYQPFDRYPDLSFTFTFDPYTTTPRSSTF